MDRNKRKKMCIHLLNTEPTESTLERALMPSKTVITHALKVSTAHNLQLQLFLILNKKICNISFFSKINETEFTKYLQNTEIQNTSFHEVLNFYKRTIKTLTDGDYSIHFNNFYIYFNCCPKPRFYSVPVDFSDQLQKRLFFDLLFSCCKCSFNNLYCSCKFDRKLMVEEGGFNCNCVVNSGKSNLYGDNTINSKHIKTKRCDNIKNSSIDNQNIENSSLNKKSFIVKSIENQEFPEKNLLLNIIGVKKCINFRTVHHYYKKYINPLQCYNTDHTFFITQYICYLKKENQYTCSVCGFDVGNKIEYFESKKDFFDELVAKITDDNMDILIHAVKHGFCNTTKVLKVILNKILAINNSYSCENTKPKPSVYKTYNTHVNHNIYNNTQYSFKSDKCFNSENCVDNSDDKNVIYNQNFTKNTSTQRIIDLYLNKRLPKANQHLDSSVKNDSITPDSYTNTLKANKTNISHGVDSAIQNVKSENTQERMNSNETNCQVNTDAIEGMSSQNTCSNHIKTEQINIISIANDTSLQNTTNVMTNTIYQINNVISQKTNFLSSSNADIYKTISLLKHFDTNIEKNEMLTINTIKVLLKNKKENLIKIITKILYTIQLTPKITFSIFYVYYFIYCDGNISSYDHNDVNGFSDNNIINHTDNIKDKKFYKNEFTDNTFKNINNNTDINNIMGCELVQENVSIDNDSKKINATNNQYIKLKIQNIILYNKHIFNSILNYILAEINDTYTLSSIFSTSHDVFIENNIKYLLNFNHFMLTDSQILKNIPYYIANQKSLNETTLGFNTQEIFNEYSIKIISNMLWIRKYDFMFLEKYIYDCYGFILNNINGILFDIKSFFDDNLDCCSGTKCFNSSVNCLNGIECLKYNNSDENNNKTHSFFSENHKFINIQLKNAEHVFDIFKFLISAVKIPLKLILPYLEYVIEKCINTEIFCDDLFDFVEDTEKMNIYPYLSVHKLISSVLFIKDDLGQPLKTQIINNKKIKQSETIDDGGKCDIKTKSSGLCHKINVNTSFNADCDQNIYSSQKSRDVRNFNDLNLFKMFKEHNNGIKKSNEDISIIKTINSLNLQHFIKLGESLLYGKSKQSNKEGVKRFSYILRNYISTNGLDCYETTYKYFNLIKNNDFFNLINTYVTLSFSANYYEFDLLSLIGDSYSNGSVIDSSFSETKNEFSGIGDMCAYLINNVLGHFCANNQDVHFYVLQETLKFVEDEQLSQDEFKRFRYTKYFISEEDYENISICNCDNVSGVNNANAYKDEKFKDNYIMVDGKVSLKNSINDTMKFIYFENNLKFNDFLTLLLQTLVHVFKRIDNNISKILKLGLLLEDSAKKEYIYCGVSMLPRDLISQFVDLINLKQNKNSILFLLSLQLRTEIFNHDVCIELSKKIDNHYYLVYFLEKSKNRLDELLRSYYLINDYVSVKAVIQMMPVVNLNTMFYGFLADRDYEQARKVLELSQCRASGLKHIGGAHEKYSNVFKVDSTLHVLNNDYEKLNNINITNNFVKSELQDNLQYINIFMKSPNEIVDLNEVGLEQKMRALRVWGDLQLNCVNALELRLRYCKKVDFEAYNNKERCVGNASKILFPYIKQLMLRDLRLNGEFGKAISEITSLLVNEQWYTLYEYCKILTCLNRRVEAKCNIKKLISYIESKPDCCRALPDDESNMNANFNVKKDYYKNFNVKTNPYSLDSNFNDSKTKRVDHMSSDYISYTSPYILNAILQNKQSVYEDTIKKFSKNEKLYFYFAKFLQEKNDVQTVNAFTKSIAYGSKYHNRSIPLLLHYLCEKEHKPVFYKSVKPYFECLQVEPLKPFINQILPKLNHKKNEVNEIISFLLIKLLNIHTDLFWNAMIFINMNEKILKVVEQLNLESQLILKEYKLVCKFFADVCNIKNDGIMNKVFPKVNSVVVPVCYSGFASEGCNESVDGNFGGCSCCNCNSNIVNTCDCCNDDTNTDINCNSTVCKNTFKNNRIDNKNYNNFFNINSAPVYIESVDSKILTFKTLQAPKRITLICSDGKNRLFLCKPNDDLRKDSRFMDLLKTLNCVLKCKIKIYNVIPITHKHGLIEWINGLRSLKSILYELYAKNRLDPDVTIRKYRNKKKVGVNDFQTVVSMYPPVLNQFIKSFNAMDWFLRRQLFIKTYSVMCCVGWFLGLGDRHCENIMFTKNCETVHVDLNCLFESGKKFEIPEVVPFRLTQNIIDGFGLLKCDGVFNDVFISTMNILRSNRELVLCNLLSFVYDPLWEWNRRISAQAVISSLENKISCDDVGEKVEELVNEACCDDNLANMYIGWAGFL